VKIDLQYDLANMTPADANPVEANFNRIEQYTNQELIERDGSVAMRAQLRLFGDPVNALDAAPKQYVDQILPIGIIMLYGGAGAPPGGRWAECNGAELQTSDYPDLAALLSTRYVTGTPSAGRFNLPNLNGRFPMGTNAGTTPAIGEQGGLRDASYTQHHHVINHNHATFNSGNDIAAHTHGVSLGTGTETGTHAHNAVTGAFVTTTGTGGGSAAGAGTDFVPQNKTATEDSFHSHLVSGPTLGPDQKHQHTVDIPAFTGNSGTTVGPLNEVAVPVTDKNLPPYLGITYIIRVS
jgi:microcystin-dependent protein